MRHLFNHEFTHQRLVTTTDQYGDPTVERRTLGTIRGRMRPANITEQFVASVAAVTIDYVFYCEPGPDIRRGDLISGGGVTMEVIAVKDPSLAGHHLEVEGKQVVV